MASGLDGGAWVTCTMAPNYCFRETMETIIILRLLLGCQIYTCTMYHDCVQAALDNNHVLTVTSVHMCYYLWYIIPTRFVDAVGATDEITL